MNPGVNCACVHQDARTCASIRDNEGLEEEDDPAPSRECECFCHEKLREEVRATFGDVE